MKCDNYLKQDEKAKRDTSNNVSPADYDYFKALYHSNPRCYMCCERFTRLNKPTLDRIDNNIAHTKENVKFCCQSCNVYRKNRDADEIKLLIQLRKYCIKNNLPMTLSHEPTYHILRAGITGGLSNVMHRVNIKGETHINHFRYKRSTNTVISEDNEHDTRMRHRFQLIISFIIFIDSESKHSIHRRTHVHARQIVII